eukprot:gene3184-2340_t
MKAPSAGGDERDSATLRHWGSLVLESPRWRPGSWVIGRIFWTLRPPRPRQRVRRTNETTSSGATVVAALIITEALLDELQPVLSVMVGVNKVLERYRLH